MELQAHRFKKYLHMEYDLKLLLTFMELTQQIGRNKSGKGCGEDVLPYEIHKSSPQKNRVVVMAADTEVCNQTARTFGMETRNAGEAFEQQSKNKQIP